jgi:hypothetical protein
MRYPKEFVTYLEGLVAYLTVLIKAEEYYYVLRCNSEDHEDDSTLGGSHVSAQIDVDSAYLHFVLNVYPDLYDTWKSGKHERVAFYILHEMCHILVDPLARFMRADAAPSQNREITDTVERQTQRIANAIMAALPRGWWKPERLKRAV